MQSRGLKMYDIFENISNDRLKKAIMTYILFDNDNDNEIYLSNIINRSKYSDYKNNEELTHIKKIIRKLDNDLKNIKKLSDSDRILELFDNLKMY